GVLWVESARLNLLSLGDEEAASLGVPVGRTRALVLLAASLSVAGAVALAGLVGFVGLIVPHLLRLWLGPDQRLLVPASALGGAAFLVLADAATPMLFPVFHAEPPVGVVTAVLGGPLFVWLLNRREHPVWARRFSRPLLWRGGTAAAPSRSGGAAASGPARPSEGWWPAA